MKTMSKRARLEATFAGDPVDRPAVALWRHWPVDDRHGAELARATLTFQQSYDFDFIKVTPIVAPTCNLVAARHAVGQG